MIALLWGTGQFFNHRFFVSYYIEISTYHRFIYHRFVSPTQTLEDIEQQIQSLEIWGKAAHNVYQSNIPKVKAFIGKLPENTKGIEFSTDVPLILILLCRFDGFSSHPRSYPKSLSLSRN